MIKSDFTVIVESVSKAKEGSKNFGYAEFLFTGGKINIAIDASQYKELENKEDEEILCSFGFTPQSVVQYGRAETLFKATKFLNIVS